MQTMPAASACATSVASAFAGSACASKAEPAVVGVPRMSNRSFQVSGTPSIGPSGVLARQRAVARSACARARDTVSCVNTPRAVCARARQRSATCVGVSSRRA